MTPRGQTRIRLWAALLIASSAIAQGADSRPAPETPAQTHYYAIVGAVAAPATYASHRSRVPLHEVLDRAGGLTDAASGGIGIFLKGHQFDQVFISPGQPGLVLSDVPSGAIIVVESKTIARADRGSEFTYIACQNLLERPVVLWGDDPAMMTLPKLLQALGQTRIDPHAVKVFPQTVQLTHENVIPSGTLLVFDQTAIDRAALDRVLEQWPLPDVCPLDDQEPIPHGPPAAASAAVTPPAYHPHRDVSVSTAAPSTANAGLDLESDFSTERIESRAPILPAGLTQEESPAPPPPGSDLAVVIPNEGLVAVSEETPDALQQLNALAAAPVKELKSNPFRSRSETTAPPRDLSGDGDVQLPRDLTLKPGMSLTDTGETTPHSKRSATGLGSQIALAAAVAGLLAALATLGALFWSRRERSRLRQRRRESSRNDTSDADSETTTPQRHPLDLLINNELSIVNEEVVLPQDTVFYGRAVGYRYLLHSQEQALRGPHFGSPAPKQVRRVSSRHQYEAVPEESSAPTVGAEKTRSGVHRSDQGRGPTATPSPLERALRAQERESAS